MCLLGAPGIHPHATVSHLFGLLGGVKLVVSLITAFIAGGPAAYETLGLLGILFCFLGGLLAILMMGKQFTTKQA